MTRSEVLVKVALNAYTSACIMHRWRTVLPMDLTHITAGFYPLLDPEYLPDRFFNQGMRPA